MFNRLRRLHSARPATHAVAASTFRASPRTLLDLGLTAAASTHTEKHMKVKSRPSGWTLKVLLGLWEIFRPTKYLAGTGIPCTLIPAHDVFRQNLLVQASQQISRGKKSPRPFVSLGTGG